MGRTCNHYFYYHGLCGSIRFTMTKTKAEIREELNELVGLKTSMGQPGWFDDAELRTMAIRIAELQDAAGELEAEAEELTAAIEDHDS